MDPLKLVLGALTVLGAIIGVFWKMFMEDRAKSTAKHAECEKDRVALWGAVNSANMDLAVMKGCQTEPCGARASLIKSRNFTVQPSTDTRNQ